MNIKGTVTAIMAVIGVASCRVGAAYAYGKKKFNEGKRAFAKEAGLNYDKYEKRINLGDIFRKNKEES